MFFFISAMGVASMLKPGGFLFFIFETNGRRYKTHHEVELGRVVADHFFEIESGNIGKYIVMSNLYAADAR